VSKLYYIACGCSIGVGAGMMATWNSVFSAPIFLFGVDLLLVRLAYINHRNKKEVSDGTR